MDDIDTAGFTDNSTPLGSADNIEVVIFLFRTLDFQLLLDCWNSIQVVYQQPIKDNVYKFHLLVNTNNIESIEIGSTEIVNGLCKMPHISVTINTKHDQSIRNLWKGLLNYKLVLTVKISYLMFLREGIRAKILKIFSAEEFYVWFSGVVVNLSAS